MTDTITTIPEALEEAARLCEDGLPENGRLVYWSGGDMFARAIRALSARVAAPVATVKPLEWAQQSPKFISAEAFGVTGYFRVMRSGDGWELQYPGGSAMMVLDGFETQAEAKAAAQKRHDEVSGSALNIQPAAQVQAEAVALKPGQYVCERCGQVAWGGDHVCPGAPAAPVAVEPVLHEHYADNAPWEDGWTLAYGPGGATTVKHIGSTNGSMSTVAIYSLREGMIAFAKAHALTIQPAAQVEAEAVACPHCGRDSHSDSKVV